ncbi:hypothetical protein N7532_002639 [Penicillium argentinense]|uniref:FAD dependent oxidoreductase domain-containing protein n=1 Tax=Penicillium argentinense TaxID=1131581 RepID=A0A9W9KKF1_9EURO|nr:uncharacterized protein N7532_002639 [Penicillium argentinense]KAJ5109994.1 hypothetical protein N7532_002639 [Penicillium argentinense]
MDYEVLIIGAGIFGLSTAYHLAQRSTTPSRIAVLDRAPPPSTNAASTDLNKIVRADYSNALYLKLGLEAIEAWKTNPLFRHAGVYHQTGWIMCDERGSDLGSRIRRNFAEVGSDPMRMLSEEEVRRSWGGVLQDADLSPFGHFYFNPLAGWADASRAVEIMAEEIQRLGVRYLVDEAEVLVLGGEGVEGVRTKSGNVYTGKKVLLCTGAWTSALMSSVEDALDIPDSDRVEAQMTAAGVCVAHVQLSEEERLLYDQLPVYVYGGQGRRPHAPSVHFGMMLIVITGEVIPPTASGILKFTYSTSFQNTIHTPTGHTISIPPSDSQSTAPESLRNECLASIRPRLPSLLTPDHKIDYYRLCWDAITPDQHPLITAHPHAQLSNLYLAAGGSFHCWKFLPTIGQYVANVLAGTSNGADRDQWWAWKTQDENEQGGVHDKLRPHREWNNWR